MGILTGLLLALCLLAAVAQTPETVQGVGYVEPVMLFADTCHPALKTENVTV